MLNAIKEYSDFGRNIYLVEGMMDFGTATIRRRTEEYINIIGQKPVIFVDYIQVLASTNQKRSLTDKQMTDINVAELKRISRDFDVPLLAISSFNRDSYTLPVDKGSFKETGSIEYDSDVLIGLQYYGWDYSSGEKAKDGVRAERLRLLQAKNKEAGKKRKNQEIQLKVLKARFGTEDDCRFDFWPAFTFFKEV